MITHQLEQMFEQDENPKLEFKRDWYSGANKLDDKGWGEFLKDIYCYRKDRILEKMSVTKIQLWS